MVSAFTSFRIRVRLRRDSHVAARALGLLALLALAFSGVACARPEAPPLALSSASPPDDYATTIARARELRDRALSLHAPSADEFTSQSDDAIAERLKQWATSRREATQDAHRAYAEALLAATSPAQEAAIHGELAELWLRLEEDTRGALFASTPAAYRDDPSLVGAVQGAAVYAFRPVLERVESHLRACEQALSQAPSAPAGTTCTAVALRLSQADDPRVPSAAPQNPGAPENRVAAESPAPRAIVPTTHPKPCTFKGTLFTSGTVYESESGSSVLFTITPGAPIEVESLAVASTPGGRYKVAVSWPRAVVGYLDAEDGPFTLTRTVELEAGAVWAAEGERVSASDTRGATVLATHAKKTSGTNDAGGDRRLFCHDLELATPRKSDARVGSRE